MTWVPVDSDHQFHHLTGPGPENLLSYWGVPEMTLYVLHWTRVADCTRILLLTAIILDWLGIGQHLFPPAMAAWILELTPLSRNPHPQYPCWNLWPCLKIYETYPPGRTQKSLRVSSSIHTVYSTLANSRAQNSFNFGSCTTRSPISLQPPQKTWSTWTASQRYHDFTYVSKSKASKLAEHQHMISKSHWWGHFPTLWPYLLLVQRNLWLCISSLMITLLPGSFVLHTHPMELQFSSSIKIQLCIDFLRTHWISKKTPTHLWPPRCTMDGHEFTPRSTSDMCYHLVQLLLETNGKPHSEPNMDFQVVGNYWRFNPMHLQAFQWFMNDIFAWHDDVKSSFYLDDILIYSDNMSEHKAHVQKYSKTSTVLECTGSVCRELVWSHIKGLNICIQKAA